MSIDSNSTLWKNQMPHLRNFEEIKKNQIEIFIEKLVKLKIFSKFCQLCLNLPDFEKFWKKTRQIWQILRKKLLEKIRRSFKILKSQSSLKKFSRLDSFCQNWEIFWKNLHCLTNYTKLGKDFEFRHKLLKFSNYFLIKIRPENNESKIVWKCGIYFYKKLYNLFNPINFIEVSNLWLRILKRSLKNWIWVDQYQVSR